VSLRCQLNVNLLWFGITDLLSFLEHGNKGVENFFAVWNNLIGWEDESVTTGIPEFVGITEWNLQFGLNVIDGTTTGFVDSLSDVSVIVLGTVSLRKSFYSFTSNGVEFVIIFKMSRSVSVGKEKKLRVTVEGDVGEDLVAHRRDVLREGFGFDLGERGLAGVRFGTAVARCTSGHPFEVPVSVGIGTFAETIAW